VEWSDYKKAMGSAGLFFTVCSLSLSRAPLSSVPPPMLRLTQRAARVGRPCTAALAALLPPGPSAAFSSLARAAVCASSSPSSFSLWHTALNSSLLRSSRTPLYRTAGSRAHFSSGPGDAPDDSGDRDDSHVPEPEDKSDRGEAPGGGKDMTPGRASKADRAALKAKQRRQAKASAEEKKYSKARLEKLKLKARKEADLARAGT
jgi:hypothetical protein